MVQRRSFLKLGVVLGASGVLGTTSMRRAMGTVAHEETVAALTEAATAELTAARRYRRFAGAALRDRLPGVGCLFEALSVSEGIHADTYTAVLNQLGVRAAPRGAARGPIGDTKANLIAAAEGEIHSIDVRYPKILRRLGREKVPDAVGAAQWAWASHRQHRDLIRSIDRHATWNYEAVVTRIESTVDGIWVCRVCGSTLHEEPAHLCPICARPANHYREIARAS